MMLKILSLFSGIGGLEKGLEDTGQFQTIAQVEIDKYASKVLRKHWPGVHKWKDIKIFNKLLRKQTSSAEASPARILALPERAEGCAENEVVCGGKCYRPFAWYDQESSSWKTFQHSLTGAWIPYSDPWPTAGMMRNGIAYRLEELELPITENDCSLSLGTVTANPENIRSEKFQRATSPTPMEYAMRWPTPRSACKDMGTMEMSRYSGTDRKSGKEEARYSPENGGQLNPTWIEWLMGFPDGWTDLDV